MMTDEEFLAESEREAPTTGLPPVIPRKMTHDFLIIPNISYYV